ncbi:hypothetical protein AB1Y20_008496 [Prymnesium parvum]|uniref:Uncharacterized protein n=1 Tax=Prymnesium parvum TaxID=97485 RepID=A0AB34IRA1_PRYPA
MRKPEKERQSKTMGGGVFGGVGSLYDANWQEKREAGYTVWMNFVLCEEASRQGVDPSTLDAGERQRLSLRQLEQHRNDALLRRRTVALLRSQVLLPVLTKVEQEIETGVLRVRPKLNLMADVSL